MLSTGISGQPGYTHFVGLAFLCTATRVRFWPCLTPCNLVPGRFLFMALRILDVFFPECPPGSRIYAERVRVPAARRVGNH